MTGVRKEILSGVSAVSELTGDWGDGHCVSRYLNRCRVDTPLRLVDAVWAHVADLRPSVGKVVEFGAGDGRFAQTGKYVEYLGYEINSSLFENISLPTNARIVNSCAFSDTIFDADLCIGNPPYVRNQDLPMKWRKYVSERLKNRTGVNISGLANAWQYFFLLALASTKNVGLCALLVPYEWVSRPSAQALRNFISSNGWNVKVYRLTDKTFDDVLTTSSITIVDKDLSNGKWSYFEETAEGKYTAISSPSGAEIGVLPYMRKTTIPQGAPIAKRGLSPGTQRVLTLTEGERVRNGLAEKRDVVPCVTSLRCLPQNIRELNSQTFQQYYRDEGQKCWLIRTDRQPSSVLQGYLDTVPLAACQTATCLEREHWWKFRMPPVPQLLVAQAFKGTFPKAVRNCENARAVGGVCGIYDIGEEQIRRFLHGLGGLDLRDRIVSHSNGFRKIEINQLNSLLMTDYKGIVEHG